MRLYASFMLYHIIALANVIRHPINNAVASIEPRTRVESVLENQLLSSLPPFEAAYLDARNAASIVRHELQHGKYYWFEACWRTNSNAHRAGSPECNYIGLVVGKVVSSTWRLRKKKFKSTLIYLRRDEHGVAYQKFEDYKPPETTGGQLMLIWGGRTTQAQATASDLVNKGQTWLDKKFLEHKSNQYSTLVHDTAHFEYLRSQVILPEDIPPAESDDED